MTHGQQYRTIRQAIGSQAKVAALLGVDLRTVQRRECGHIPVTREAMLALTILRHERTQTAGATTMKTILTAIALLCLTLTVQANPFGELDGLIQYHRMLAEGKRLPMNWDVLSEAHKHVVKPATQEKIGAALDRLDKTPMTMHEQFAYRARLRMLDVLEQHQRGQFRAAVMQGLEAERALNPK